MGSFAPRGSQGEGEATNMIRSMTGFGEARADVPGGRVVVEIRTVNHRYFRASFWLPPGLDRWEGPLTEELRGGIVRGHAQVSVALEFAEPAAPVTLDTAKARGYLAALQELRDAFGLPGEIDLHLLASFGDVFRPRADAATDVPLEPVLAAAREALARVREMREAEGAILRRDMATLLEGMEAELAAIEARAPERLRRERDRLRDAVRELTGGPGGPGAPGGAVDEDRLAREIAYLAERWDIHEEIVRFRSHLEQWRAALDQTGGEPVGRRLGFLVQELHREANTLGAKANDAEIAHRVIALKTAIEKLREQVENVE